MKIGISGASGHLGRAVIERLKELTGNHTVVGISRSPESVVYADEVRFGDYNVPDQLPAAYRGLDRLLIIPTLDTEYGARARQLVAAIDAAQAAGVGHVVLISDVGTREEAEPCVGAASWTAEQRLIKSMATWTILRANYFMESYAQEALLWLATGRLLEFNEHRVGFVSRDDVAAAAAGILVGEGHSGAIYNATGSEALSVDRRAALISRIGGRPVEVVHTSQVELRKQLQIAGFPADYLDIVLDTKRKAAESGFDMVTGDVERLSGRPPLSLEQVLENYIATGGV